MTDQQPEHVQKQPAKETPLTELQKTQQRMEEYLDGWKRAKADYLNLKKESEKREKEIVQFANAGLILELMPIYDNFKLAWQHIPEEHRKNDTWLKGIEHIKRQFADLLKNLGIEEIKTVGEKFDPEFHDAVAKEKREGAVPGTIIEEVKGGYKLYDKVLEHAKVKVAE
ncbi:MAG: nucleotide exchange factor GrpE [Patescibacteria group bacterium]|nr:nucleotide exchange factor GrpE [Patescibacteria group bacterium]MDD5715310.1 nucleotide exchange factor GrpE [Patescibacteria group bacterium]